MRRIQSEAGFTLIDVLFAMAVMGLLAAIALPGLLRARAQATTAAAIGTLRVINSAQFTYAITCGSGYYAPNLTTLGTPGAGTTHAFIPADLGRANVVVKTGYSIQMTGIATPSAPPSCNGLGAGLGTLGYRAGADSLTADFAVHYSTNTTGSVWVGQVPLYATTGEADPPPAGTLIR